MFDFLFKSDLRNEIQGVKEKNASLSAQVENLKSELSILKTEFNEMKNSLAESQMSLGILLTATQGIAEDLAALYSTYGIQTSYKDDASLSKKGMVIPLMPFDDEDYEN